MAQHAADLDVVGEVIDGPQSSWHPFEANLLMLSQAGDPKLVPERGFLSISLCKLDRVGCHV
jgi:hypothetical protein